jgi:membrane protein implicated in regulation of membrane protease activity
VTQWQWAAIIWGSIGAAFAVAELTAATGLAPWPTLSTTVKGIEGLWVWAAFILLTGLIILTVHLTWRFLPPLLKEIGG